MSQLEPFVFLPYSRTEFIIPKKDICTVFSSMEFSAVGRIDWDAPARISFKDSLVPVVSFDSCAALFGEACEAASVTTVVVVRGGVSPGDTMFALVTSADCRIENVPVENLSSFSGVCVPMSDSFGLKGCRFSEGKIGMVLDIPVFVAAARRRGAI